MNESADPRPAFERAFGLLRPEDFTVAAPGRVNLMGDHIDYLGFGVLPMALAQRVRMLVRPRDDDRIRVVNACDVFPPVEFTAHGEIAAAPAGDWGNYIRAAVHGLQLPAQRRGFDAALASDIPRAAGLSSSSAIVVAAAQAYVHANGESVEPLALAERLAAAERFVGTRGGGMDQAVCLLARAGTACHIDFDPLRVTHVPVPPDWRFIVAHSLETAEKGAAARAAYNRLASRARGALERVQAQLDRSAGEAVEMATLLEAGTHILDEPAQRAYRHALTEAQRVMHAADAMRAGDAIAFGQLMQESHASLRDIGVSTASLDALVDCLMNAGALGARLTGAGMGGCAVALCRDADADHVLAVIDATFYAVRALPKPGDQQRFIAVPSRGAAVS